MRLPRAHAKRRPDSIVLVAWQNAGVDYIACLAKRAPHDEGTKRIFAGAYPFWGRGSTHDARRVQAIAGTAALVLTVCVCGYALYTATAATANAESPYPGSLFGLAALVSALVAITVPYVLPFTATRLAFGRLLGEVRERLFMCVMCVMCSLGLCVLCFVLFVCVPHTPTQ